MAWIWRILAWLYAFAPQHRLWAIACQQIEWVCDTVYGGHEISDSEFNDTLDRLEWAEWAASHYAPKHLRQTLLAAWTRGDEYEVVVERIRLVLDVLSHEPGRPAGPAPTPFIRPAPRASARKRALGVAPALSPLSPPPPRRARGPPSRRVHGAQRNAPFFVNASPGAPCAHTILFPNAAARALARGRRRLLSRFSRRGPRRPSLFVAMW